MAGWGHSSTRLFLTPTLIASLIGSLLCGAVRADDRSASKPLRIRSASFAPIGKVFSLGEISINGRPAHGEQLLWNGDLLEVSDDASALLDSIGILAIIHGSAVRLATEFTAPNDNTQRRVLIATLIVGEMIVSLQPESFAHIEASESAFTTSDGASFRLSINCGRAVFDRVSGGVSAEPQGSQSKYLQFTTKEGLSLGAAPKKKVKLDTPEDLYTLLKRPKAPSPRRVLFALGVRPINQQEFSPAPPGKVVAFSLDPPANGAFNPPGARATTDSRGIATITFTGKISGPAQITATDVETGETASLVIMVGKAPGIFRQRNILIAAAALGIVICVFACAPKTEPLRQVPPPIIP